MVEYLLSGTPLLTTKLSGVPDEYDQYCYLAQGRASTEIAEQIDCILWDKEANALAAKACAFVKEKKNCNIQTQQMLTFFKQQVKG